MSYETKTREELLVELKELKTQIELRDGKIKEMEVAGELNPVFDMVGNGIRIIDMNLNVVRINETFCRMAGVSKEEALARKCYEVFKGSWCHTEKCSLTRILAGEKVVQYEVEKTRENGDVVPCSLIAKPLYDHNGAIIGIIEDFKDITVIKVSERALRESEEKFRSYVDMAPDGIFIVDRSGKYFDVNPAGCQLLGYTKEELLEKRIAELAVSNTGHFERLLQDGVSRGEVSLKRKDGSILTFDLFAVDMGNGYFLGYKRDVTAKREVQEALRESESHNNLVINGISDIVILYEVESEGDFRVIKANDSCLKAINRTRDEVIGKLIQEILPPEEAQKLIQNDAEAVRKGKPIRKEAIFSFGHFDINFIPVNDETGNCKYLIVTAQDISERKKMEEHLLKIEKIESVGLLAGGIAHDFNNILTVISGNTSLAKMKMNKIQGDLKDDILTILTEVEQASLQARHLTHQLLTFSKGGVPIVKTESIGELVQKTAEFTLRGSNVKCEFHIPEDLWLVEVDSGQISQVLNNLIINADQAMPQGGVIKLYGENITVAGKNLLPIEKGEYVKISVEDTGIGIDKKYFKNIFDPYFTTKQKGSGLGLTSAYSIVRKHGGCITVDSKVGFGTTFNIYLKASKNKELVKSSVKAQVEISKGGRILVMDDQEMLRRVLSEMLMYMGYEVVCAKDGQEAIQIYKKAKESLKPFDAVIMDLTVPGGMGGKEALEELLRYDSDIQAIVSSGYSKERIMANFIDHGFKAVVTKPFSIEELGATLEEVLRKDGVKVS